MQAVAVPIVNIAAPLAIDPLPLRTNVPLLALMAPPPLIVPLTVRVPVPLMVETESKVIPPEPTVTVAPEVTVIVVVLLPETLPWIVSELMLTVRSAVAMNDAFCELDPMTTSSPLTGTTPPTQLPVLLQFPVVVPFQVFVARTPA